MTKTKALILDNTLVELDDDNITFSGTDGTVTITYRGLIEILQETYYSASEIEELSEDEE